MYRLKKTLKIHEVTHLYVTVESCTLFFFEFMLFDFEFLIDIFIIMHVPSLQRLFTKTVV
jgi:hypothetical protein